MRQPRSLRRDPRRDGDRDARVIAASHRAPDAQSPPPSGPGSGHRRTVAITDVPVFLNAIGTVQAFNMVTIKSRVDGQIVQGRL